MSLTVVFRETALHGLAGLRREDPASFVQARRAITSLADRPRPDGAVAWGGSGTYRLQADGVRVLYEVDDAASTVFVINVGRAR